MRRTLLLMIPPKLFLILLLAFFLRIINITNNPAGLYGDELTMALDVNSILQTGFDQTGKFLPLNFTMGGGRPVGYGYFSTPFVALFGQAELGIRLLSVFSGIGIIFLTYHLGRILFSSKIGLLGAVLMTISPWSLSLSRGGFETHYALFLAMLMVVTFLLSKKRSFLIILSALGFGLSINTYSTYKLSLPLFIPLLFWFANFKQALLTEKKHLYLICAGIILLSFSVLLFYQIFFNSSESRFLNQNIFANKDLEFNISKKVEEHKNLSMLNNEIDRFFANKYWEYGSLITKNYLSSFSFDFLFLLGDKNPRHNLTSSGVLYLVEVISIIFGFAYLLRAENLRKLFFLSGWLLIGPLSASLLNDPHALRSSFMLPPLVLISAVGLDYLWFLKKNYFAKTLIIILIIGFLMQFTFVVYNLYFINVNKYSRFWGYPAKMASELAIKGKEKYDLIFVSDRVDAIEFAYPVYANINPKEILTQNKTQTKVGDYQFKVFDNVYIGPIPDSAAEDFLENIPKSSILYIGPAEDKRYLKAGFEILNGKDGKEALVVKHLDNVNSK